MKTHPFWMIAFMITASCVASATDTIQHVVIVLDASGSMNETMKNTSVPKIDAAKSALLQVLRQVPEDTHVGVIVFSSQNKTNEWIYPLGPMDIPRLEQSIRDQKTGGKTPLGATMQKALNRLLEERDKQYGYGTYRLLIVTDGEADDPRLVDTIVPSAMARGIRMDVIGVDMARKHTLATQVHSYRSADDPESLTRAISEVLGEVTDQGTDSVDQELFAQLAGIPDELAAAMLNALANTAADNRLIDPPSEPVKKNDKGTPVVTGSPTQPTEPSKNRRHTNRIVSVIAVILLVRHFVRQRHRRQMKR